MLGRHSNLNRNPQLFALSSLFFFLFFVCQSSGMTASLEIERILTPESPPLERPNILLLVIDALRRDHLGCYGYQRDTSPVIDRLSREGKKQFAVGQRLDFALMRSSKRQDQIAVEGFFDRMENQTEEVKIELFCEGKKLGERIIEKAGFFSVRFPVSSSLGKDRTLVFSLLFNGPFGLGRTDVKGNNQAIPLLISAIFFD